MPLPYDDPRAGPQAGVSPLIMTVSTLLRRLAYAACGSYIGVGYVDYIAIALFVLLFACAEQVVGSHYFPSLSGDQEVRLALAASFLFGIISAWRKDG